MAPAMAPLVRTEASSAHEAVQTRPDSEPRSRRLAALQRKAEAAKAWILPQGKDDTEANVDVGKALGIAFLIIGAVVTVLVVAGLTPAYVSGVSNATAAVQNADFGNDTVNALTSPMALLIGIGGLFGIVGIVIGAIAISRS